MPSVDTAMGTLTVPIWAAGAVCAVLVVAIVLAVRRTSGVAVISDAVPGRRSSRSSPIGGWRLLGPRQGRQRPKRPTDARLTSVRRP